MKKTIFLFLFCINLWPNIKLEKVYYQSFSLAIAQIQSSEDIHECEDPILGTIYTTLDCEDIETNPKTTCEVCGNIHYRNQECPNIELCGLCNTKHHPQESCPSGGDDTGETSGSSISGEPVINRWTCLKCKWIWYSNSHPKTCPNCGSWSYYIFY